MCFVDLRLCILAMLMRDETVERPLPITQHSYHDIYLWPWGGYTDRVIEMHTDTGTQTYV